MVAVPHHPMVYDYLEPGQLDGHNATLAYFENTYGATPVNWFWETWEQNMFRDSNHLGDAGREYCCKRMVAFLNEKRGNGLRHDRILPLFPPLVFLLTFGVASRQRRRQILILLVMSYVFFWLASGWHLILLLISTCIDWTAGRKMHETDDHVRRKRWLRISLVTNLSLLGVFKYLDFLIELELGFAAIHRIVGRGCCWACVTGGYFLLHLPNDVLHH